MPTTYNKVTIDGDTLIDLSGDTVSSAADIVSGKTGHLNDGSQVTGSALTYSSADNGKVVSNGALVAQGSDTVTQNGTIDTTLISSLVVNVTGGTNPVKTATGTFTGNGTRQVTISSTFEPDLIYWTSDPGTTASSGVVAGIIAREMMAASRYRNNSTTNSHYAVIDITAMNTGGSSYSFRATYADNTITLYGFSNNARALFTNDRTYTYKLVKWTT